MRMYSDIQVRLITVLEVLAGVFVAAALVFGGFYFGSKAGAGQITRTPAFSSDGEYRFTGEPLVFDHLAASDDVSFSVDEQRNIEIYQARNKGVVNISTETLSSIAIKVRKRAESRTPAMPITRFLGNPLAS